MIQSLQHILELLDRDQMTYISTSEKRDFNHILRMWVIRYSSNGIDLVTAVATSFQFPDTQIDCPSNLVYPLLLVWLLFVFDTAMIEERANLPEISLQPVVVGAARKTSRAVGRATKGLMNMISGRESTTENDDDDTYIWEIWWTQLN